MRNDGRLAQIVVIQVVLVDFDVLAHLRGQHVVDLGLALAIGASLILSQSLRVQVLL